MSSRLQLRSLRLLIAAAALVLCVALQTGTASATSNCPSGSTRTIFGQSVGQGGTLSNRDVHQGILKLSQGTVTVLCDAATGSATITGTVVAGADATPVKVTQTYKDDSNWSLIVSANAAGSGYTPPAWSSVNLNALEGSVIKASGVVTFSLAAKGYIMGSVKIDLAVSVDSSGWTGTFTIDNTHIGGLTINNATITATSTSRSASIAGSLSTNGGDFDAYVSATGGDPAKTTKDPQTWSLFIQLSAANLNGSVPTLKVNSFWANTSISSADATTCINVTFAAGGSFTIQDKDYAMQEFSFSVNCNKLTSFVVDMIVSHEQSWNGSTREAWFTFKWYKPTSNLTTLALPWNDAINYYGGFVGAADLSSVRHYHNRYEGKDFDRDVTVGIGLSAGMVAWNAGQSSLSPFVEIGGWVEADRVSGNLSCLWQSSGTDADCKVHMRLNPSWADIYYYDWNDL